MGEIGFIVKVGIFNCKCAQSYRLFCLVCTFCTQLYNALNYALSNVRYIALEKFRVIKSLSKTKFLLLDIPLHILSHCTRVQIYRSSLRQCNTHKRGD